MWVAVMLTTLHLLLYVDVERGKKKIIETRLSFGEGSKISEIARTKVWSERNVERNDLLCESNLGRCKEVKKGAEGCGSLDRR